MREMEAFNKSLNKQTNPLNPLINQVSHQPHEGQDVFNQKVIKQVSPPVKQVSQQLSLIHI